MSVLILHPRHIATVAHACVQYDAPKLGYKTANDWVRNLARVQFRSACHYYDAIKACTMAGCDNEADFVNKCERALDESDSSLYSPLELLKLVDTYDYNAFENPDYDDLQGYNSRHVTQWHIDALKDRLIRKIDGYDAAPAFITDQEVPA